MLDLKVTTCQESDMQCTLGTRWCTDTSDQRQFRAKTLLHQCHPCGSPLNTGIHLEQCPFNTTLCMQVATIWPLFNPCQYYFCVSVHYYVEEIRNNQSIPLLVFGWRIFIFIVTNMLMSCTSCNIDCCFSIVMRDCEWCIFVHIERQWDSQLQQVWRHWRRGRREFCHVCISCSWRWRKWLTMMSQRVSCRLHMWAYYGLC